MPGRTKLDRCVDACVAGKPLKPNPKYKARSKKSSCYAI